MNRRYRKPPRKSAYGGFFTYPLLSAGIGLFVIFIVTLLFAFVITKIDATDFMLSVMSTIALCVGAYSGGFVSGKGSGKNGLFMGILCGIFIFLVIILLSVLFSKAVKSFTLPVKLVLTLVFAGLGGIVGVNSKHLR